MLVEILNKCYNEYSGTPFFIYIPLIYILYISYIPQVTNLYGSVDDIINNTIYY